MLFKSKYVGILKIFSFIIYAGVVQQKISGFNYLFIFNLNGKFNFSIFLEP